MLLLLFSFSFVNWMALKCSNSICGASNRRLRVIWQAVIGCRDGRLIAQPMLTNLRTDAAAIDDHRLSNC
jgi:hypothetical protein